jgi:hypothetical protein
MSTTCPPYHVLINTNKNTDKTLQVHNFYFQLFLEEPHKPTQNSYGQLQQKGMLRSKLWSVRSMYVCMYVSSFVYFFAVVFKDNESISDYTV